MGARRMLATAVESLRRKQEFDFCDGLRALAVLWVCADHGMLCVELFLQGMGARLYQLWWPVALPASGEAGVDVFLVLSGFLMGGILHRETASTGGIAMGSFVIRRLFRLFPAIFAAMLLTMVGDKAAGADPECPSQEWWMNLVIFNNLDLSDALPCLGHTWSVALELQLYMATPFLFTAAARLSSILPQKWKLTPALCVAVLCALAWAACCGIRLWFVTTTGLLEKPPTDMAWIRYYLGTQYRYSTYVAGVLVGTLCAAARQQRHELPQQQQQQQQQQPKAFGTGSSSSKGSPLCSYAAGVAIPAAFAVLLCTCFVGPDINPSMNPTGGAWYRGSFPTVAMLHAALFRPLLGAAVASLVFLCGSGLAPRCSRFLGWASFRPLAGLSYSMYLLQFVGFRLLAKPFLLYISNSLIDAPLWLGILAAYTAAALFILGCIPLAFLSYAFVELPGTRAGKRCLELLERLGAVLAFRAAAAWGPWLPGGEPSRVLGGGARGGGSKADVEQQAIVGKTSPSAYDHISTCSVAKSTLAAPPEKRSQTYLEV